MIALPRLLRFAPVLLGVLLGVLSPFGALADTIRGDDAPLRAFASQIGLHDVDGFVELVTTLRTQDHPPARYLRKSRLQRFGWKPGQDLCQLWPGRAVGGDVFLNREKRLPDARSRRWREADLDYACGARGARRLVWSNDGLFFVTLDHYATFIPLPAEGAS